MADRHEPAYLRYLSRDPKVMGGETVMAGTRIPLRTILANIEAGHSVETILREFPSLTREHVDAAIRFAAGSAKEDLPPMRPLAA